MRELVKMICTECGEENYHTDKNKKNTPGRLELKRTVLRKTYSTHRER